MTTQDAESQGTTYSESMDQGAKSQSTDTRKFSGSTDDGTIQVIHQNIPEGIEIREISYGYGLFATKFHSMGSVVYTGNQIVIPNKFAQFRLVVDNMNGAEFLLDWETHTVEFTETERWLYLFDSLINHSCDPNVVSRSHEDVTQSGLYDMVALRDIYPGDDITCDYNTYEYDTHGKTIEKCLCGSEGCIGRVAGFKFLPMDEQKKRLPYLDEAVLYAMAADSNNKFFYIPDLRVPADRVSVDLVVEESDSYKLTAARDFAKGEIIYSNDSLLFPEDSSLVIEVRGKRKWLDNLVHTVNKGNGIREFYYFDSFQNHSCEPNSAMVYHSDSEYDTIATRDIKTGDEITSDYESFDSGIDGTSFMCKCGSDNCRGLIKA